MEYKGISKDSREIRPGYIYATFEGNAHDGYDYIEDAINNGAVKIIGEREVELQEYEQVDDINVAVMKYAREIYDFPDEKLKLVGITGTDGKTSTALIIHQILVNLGVTSSYLGTNGFFIGEEEIEYTGFTTPFGDQLFKNLAQSVKAKSDVFVMEVSSHALEQGRVLGLEYDVAIFTNLGEEHLDFHENIEDYYQAKKKLFTQLKEDGVAVINIDDEYGARMAKELERENENLRLVTVGEKSSATHVIKIDEVDLNGIKFELRFDDNACTVESTLLAVFNIFNLTEAILTVNALGYPLDKIITLSKNINIPGRLEVIKKPGFPRVIIDFAHTAEAVQKVMSFVADQKLPGEKIWSITGSAGGRDSLKRPALGKAATDYADMTIFTEDDPRGESVLEINKNLKQKINNQNNKLYEIIDRKEAIKYAIDHAGEKDTIVLLGKGSMQVMYYDGYTKKYIEKEEIYKNLVGK